MIAMRVEGGDALAAALLGLSSRASRTLMREALAEGGELIRARASELAPREPGAPDIADNIVMSAARETKDRGGGLWIGPSRGFYYGMFQEFGTSRHRAQPFMRPAFDEMVRKTIAVIGTSLWRELAGRGLNRPSTSMETAVTGGPGGGLL